MVLKQKITSGLRYAGRGAKNGFFHILVGNTLVRVISALSALLLPSIVTKGQYGAFGLPDNIIQFVLLFNGLGVSTAVLRYCAAFDRPGEKRAYFRFSLRFGTLFDLALIAAAGGVLALLDAAGVYPIRPFEAQLLAGLSLTPVLAFVLDALQNFLRAGRENRGYSKISVIFTFSYAVLQVALALVFQIYGIIPGRYIAYLLAIGAGLLVLRAMPVSREKPVKLRRADKAGMIRYAVSSMLANCFSLIMPLVETAIVYKYIQDNNLRANFRVSLLAPQSLQYLAMSIVVFAFPYFARNYRNGGWIYRQAKRIYGGLSAVMAVIVTTCFLLTPAMLHLFWPKYYSPQTVHLMRVFWVTFGINAALRMPTGNILAAVGEVRFNLFNAVVSSVLQTLLCWMLVRRYALGGAAYGLLAAYAVSAAVGMLYLRRFCRRLGNRRQPPAPENGWEEQAS